MQKKNIKASILIWAIFLSLIISVTFISISTKINKNLRNNSNYIDKINVNNEIKNIINNSIINGIFTDQILSNGDEIIFEKSNDMIVSLKQNEKYLLKINEASTIGITIINGGPVKYGTGLITNSENISASIGDLEIENLGGYTRVNITSTSDKNYLSEYKNYRIIKKIGNKELIKTKGQIKNF